MDNMEKSIVQTPEVVSQGAPVKESTPEVRAKIPKVSAGTFIRQNTVGSVGLHGVNIVSLVIDAQERLCLAQISNTLLKEYSYNEIHNRRVALGITCVQCTPVQLEILRRAGAMPVSSRRCGMITKREAERLVKSFLDDISPPKLPDNFAFDVKHECGWGGRGSFMPARYNSSRAKCIKCHYCNMYFSPNKFIFHFHRSPDSKYNHPDAANFNSWRRHLKLWDPQASDELLHAWEDVKAMFNGGSRKRILSNHNHSHTHSKGGHSSIASHQPSEYPKRQKLDSDRLDQSNPSPGSPPYPGQYPVFPVPNKVMPVKTMPTHPAFLSFNYDKPAALPSPSDPQSGVKPSIITAWSGVPETYYPPYEMIWAKHLGLTTPESNFAPHPGIPTPKHSPSEQLDQNLHVNTNLPEGRPSFDESRGHIHTNSEVMGNGYNYMLDKQHRPHLSAFKPVTHRHHRNSSSSGSPSPIHSEHDYRSVGDRSCSSDPDETTRCSEDFEHDEHVDVDTIDDNECTISDATTLRRSEENNNELSSPKLPVVIEPASHPESPHTETAQPDKDETEHKSQPEHEEQSQVDNQSQPRSPTESCDQSEEGKSLQGHVTQEVPGCEENSHDEEDESRSSCRSTDSGCDKGEQETSLSSSSCSSEHRASTPPPSLWSPGRLDQPSTPILTDRTNRETELVPATGNNDVAVKERKLPNLTDLTREQLQTELRQEVAVRQKLEQDCRVIKDTFQEQVKRELAYREEMSKQLQVVRETLCQELDQERKVRYSLQQKLKEAHDALHNFSCKMLAATRQCAECSYKEPMMPR